MGPSWDYVLIGIVVVIVLLAVIATAFRHRRGGHRVEQPHDVEGPRRRPDGSRPEHLDPDPERLAGGRARLTPPFEERRG